MIRADILKAIIPVISDELVVSNIGLPSQELHMLDDQPTNFYMLGTMGLASSIGLGLALSLMQVPIRLKTLIPLSQAYKNLLVGHLAYEVLEMEVLYCLQLIRQK